MRYLLFVSLTVLCLGVGGGCRTTSRQAAPPAAVLNPATPAPFPVAPAAPGSAFPSPPVSGIPQTTPPGPAFPMAPAPGAPTGPMSGLSPEALARVEYRWQPAPSQIQLGSPQAGADGPGARLYPPDIAKPPETKEPPLAKPPATPLPVGIPQFAMAKDKVSAGLRPSFDDGLDWLKASGYKTILHVRAPGDDDQEDQKQAEKRALKYLSLELSPQTLTKEKADEFAKFVKDASLHPLFVYDRDGSLAGALWYFYFRAAEQIPDDAARIRAGSLGLREDRDSHRAMWLAIQKLLSEDKEHKEE